MRAATLMGILLAGMVASGCRPATVDRVGGVRLTYQIEDGQQFDRDELEKAVARRLQAGGLLYAKAHVSAENELLVELPGADAEKSKYAQTMLAGSGRLELRIVAERGIHDAIIENAVPTTPPTVDSPISTRESGSTTDPSDRDGRFVWVRFDSQHTSLEDWMVLRDNPAGGQKILMIVSKDDITSDDLASAYLGHDSALQPCLNGSFNRNGAKKMLKLTGENIDRRLAIVFDGTLMTAPVIRSAVEDRFQLTGRFTADEVKSMAALLQTGALPAKLAAAPTQEEKVSPK